MPGAETSETAIDILSDRR